MYDTTRVCGRGGTLHDAFDAASIHRYDTPFGCVVLAHTSSSHVYVSRTDTINTLFECQTKQQILVEPDSEFCPRGHTTESPCARAYSMSPGG